MRKIININKDWKFSKTKCMDWDAQFCDSESINLPHTWNNLDGQDGKNDYFRGTCYYAKSLSNVKITKNQKAYLEFQGVNSVAEVFLNDKKIFTHKGGYATFRVDISDYLQENNKLMIEVDNSARDDVYPQMADFTFYGGIYRDVNLIIVNSSHFELDYYGGNGIKVTPMVIDNTAEVKVETFIKGEYDFVEVTIDGIAQKGNDIVFILNEPHLWNGKENPYLYEAVARLYKNNEQIDEVRVKFGVRRFEFDAERGFFLNGKSYPLRGVSMHQDRENCGNAVAKSMHDENMALLLECGVNTVRLAHYQHGQYFYDLCDEKGIIVWAEIPYISAHMPTANENSVTQLHELIVQNYNHPSIVCWGLSNEITVCGVSDDLFENHKRLQKLAKKLDSTRPTILACVSIMGMDSPLLDIADLISYNLYFGWYNGEIGDLGEWLDTFHAKHPNIVLGLSEYGAEGMIALHSSTPLKGDYSEEYQALLHEWALEIINDRPYLSMTHLWNMFDFGSDGRDEGGVSGRNHKGLVSFNREIKKDSFYIYKAHWSNEPFVHVCGRRFKERVENESEIKVYSNCSEVSLYHNDKLIEKKKGDKIFIFKISLQQVNKLKAVGKDCTDEIVLNKVEKPRAEYALASTGIINWFEKADNGLTQKAGYYSIFDKIADILSNTQAAKIYSDFQTKVAKEQKKAPINGDFSEYVKQMTMAQIIKMTGRNRSPDEILGINNALKAIKKP